MGFPILVRCHLYIELGPWSHIRKVSGACYTRQSWAGYSSRPSTIFGYSQGRFTSVQDCVHVQASPKRLVLNHCLKNQCRPEPIPTVALTLYHKNEDWGILKQIVKQWSPPKIVHYAETVMTWHAQNYSYLIDSSRLTPKWIYRRICIMNEKS